PRRGRSRRCSGPAPRRCGGLTSATRRRWPGGRCSQLAGGLPPRALLLDPDVVLRELVNAGDPTDLALHARSGQGGALGPLDGLLLGGDVEDPEAAEQLLGLAVGAI